VKREFLQLGDTRLDVSITGQGPANVLLHGGPAAHDYFADCVLVDWLRDHRTVCSYDQRGCRQSVSAGPFTLAANIDDLEHVRETLAVEQFDLLGHSWGAYLALRYAVAHPRRVRRLVLLTPIGAREGWNIDFHRNINARHRGEQLLKLKTLKKEIGSCGDAARRKELYRQQSELAMASYMAEAYRDRAPGVEFFDRELSAETVESMVESYRDPGWERGLADLTPHVLIVQGCEDPLPAYIVDDLAAMIPQARVVRLDGCGHFPWLEKPELVRDTLLPFLLDDEPRSEEPAPCES